ncbi:MAG: FkbM family methyltransferase [Proteobacteria bacterium]|nr:FkbM family methyltransferase [Pseudomonadota bacterium]
MPPSFLDRLLACAPFRLLYLLRKIFLTRSSRRYWSQYGEDIVLDRVLNLARPGFYVDVGCFHPVKNNNTYKLYRRGWRGLNLDIDELKIAAFRLRRPRDVNLVRCVSEHEGMIRVFSPGIYSLNQTADPATAEKMRQRGVVMREREVPASPLNRILADSEFRDRTIDLLSIDVEGHELSVLRSLDFDRYQPRVVIIESHLRSLVALMASAEFGLLTAKGYTMFNWTGPSVLFLRQTAAGTK